MKPCIRRQCSTDDRSRRSFRLLIISLGVLSCSGLVIDRTSGQNTSALQAVESDIRPSRFPGAADPATGEEVYGEMVRPTRWRSPQEQRAGFHLPPGFEIRAFASEPEIAKPINIAVDGEGRVWVTQTTAYPHPDPSGASPGDAVQVLRDTTGDGHADQVTTFADGLNIPIGVLPYGDGCICFSIPNLYYLRDTTGDGVCDKREVILGPFDTTRDTHGMVNALRDGGDGWIYACHGFNNRSIVAGQDGHQVRMESGNTFRFRPDGSRVELYTQGQVNPFGLTRDDWGYWYSADCHSKPITQLIAGASYPSFGRPHDGLGFLPPTIDHLHGSTAISGIVYIDDASPLVPLRGQLLSGNVMTSRINRDLLTYRGATARGIELPDFLTSDDPWFRPVDLQLDDSGNLYVADFYNKIIGHYEVPLDHPERDRTSGRIWQIRYSPAAKSANETTAGEVDSSAAYRDAKSVRERQRELAGLDEVALAAAISDIGEARQRVVAIAVAAEREAWSSALQVAVMTALDDENAHVARAAAEAIGRVPSKDRDVRRLAERLLEVGDDDPVLRQSLRIAIRNRLARLTSDSPLWRQLLDSESIGGPNAERMATEIASILLGVADEIVVAPSVAFLTRNPETALRQELVRHAATHASVDSLGPVVGLAREITAGSLAEQGEMLEVLLAAQGKGDAAGKTEGALREWALSLANQGLESFLTTTRQAPLTVGWTTTDGQPWGLQSRPRRDAGDGLLRSSHTRGESYTGSLISDPFPAPPSIRFWIAGHGGPPDQSDHGKNLIRLVRAVDGEVLRTELTPRSDTATQIHWDLDLPDGESVRIECRDGDSGGAYAWLAIGGFEPQWIDPIVADDDLRAALRWSRRMRFDELLEPLQQIAASDRCSSSIRLEVATTIAAIRRQRDWEALLSSYADAPRLAVLAGEVVEEYLAVNAAVDAATADAANREPVEEAIRKLTSHLSAREEPGFARSWVRRGGSLESLLDVCERGWISPAVLTEDSVRELLEPRLDADTRGRLQQITAELPQSDPVDLAAQAKLLNEVESIRGDRVAGQAIYTRHCAACHQFRGSGALVGPQLDGVVTRSVARLFEDIMLPDQNVDAAFRTTSLLMEDGRVVVGMVQSEDDAEIRLADSAGKTITLATDEVETRVESFRSLMPGNLAEVLSAQDLADLISFIRNPQR